LYDIIRHRARYCLGRRWSWCAKIGDYPLSIPGDAPAWRTSDHNPLVVILAFR
jgi:hypothetical protein